MHSAEVWKFYCFVVLSLNNDFIQSLIGVWASFEKITIENNLCHQARAHTLTHDRRYQWHFHSWIDKMKERVLHAHTWKRIQLIHDWFCFTFFIHIFHFDNKRHKLISEWMRTRATNCELLSMTVTFISLSEFIVSMQWRSIRAQRTHHCQMKSPADTRSALNSILINLLTWPRVHCLWSYRM